MKFQLHKQLIRNLFLFASSLLISSFAIANTEIKLDCLLKIKRTTAKEKLNYEKNVSFEISEKSDYLSVITTNDDDLWSASTSKNEKKLEIKNLTNKNIWDIANKSESNGRENYVRIKIDKSNKEIIYYSNYMNGELIVNANGKCKN
jgi:hypothetical protein